MIIVYAEMVIVYVEVVLVYAEIMVSMVLCPERLRGERTRDPVRAAITAYPRPLLGCCLSVFPARRRLRPFG